MRKQSFFKIFLVCAFMVFILLGTSVLAAVIRVKTSGNDANSGATWALAKKTIAAAINTATEGDEIWVAAGTYTGHIKNKVLNEAIDPVPINIGLYGGFTGTETARSQRNWKTNLTILDGEGGPVPTPPDLGCVVNISGGAGRTTRIDGFVITRGHADSGGGINVFGSGPTIVNNTIWKNGGSVGGGICVVNYDFVPPTTAQPVITDNIIVENSGGSGGGIAVFGSKNLVSYPPAAPVISGNTISQNTAGAGGGIGIYGHAAPLITNNYIVANLQSSITSGGGGIYTTTRNTFNEPVEFAISAPTIISNVISANCGFLGAGIYAYDTDVGVPTITNNTIMANSGIGVYWNQSSPVITNNLVVFNAWGLQQPADAPTSPTISYNCIYGNSIQGKRTDYEGMTDQTGLNGNISIDPSMANTRIGDFRLQSGSPCIDAGTSAAVLPDWKDIFGKDRILGSRVDIGADESDGTAWSSPTPVIYVRPGGNNAQDGLTWAKAKKTILAGINKAALTGGEVWVAAGTYTEHNILPAFVYLYGGFAGTETSRTQRDIASNPTILDGGGIPTVLEVKRAGYLISTVDGFTIQNGGVYTNGVLPGGNDGYGGQGGGIYCYICSPYIENNIITHNSLGNPFDNPNKIGYGGGISTYLSFPIIKGNTITENETINTSNGSGGGIYCDLSMPTIEGNTITQNRAKLGAGIYCQMSIPRIVRNTIENNAMYHSLTGGVYIGSSDGAITLALGENFLIEGNTIKGNIAAIGAGISISTNTAGRIQNNLIINNTAWDYSGFGNGGMGGGIYLSVPPNATDNLYILNNTIYGNTATQQLLPPPMNEQGGGIALVLAASLPPPPVPPPAKLVMANNIIAFNSSGVWGYPTFPMLVPTVVKNDVYGSTSGSNCNYISISPGVTDISQDPSFVDKTSGNFHLLTSSLCKDAGDNSQIPAALTTDFDGRPRIIDGNADGNAVVDMGAYEFTSGADTTKPTVTITVPTSSPTYGTSQSVISLGGTASDNVGVTSVVWSNDRGGNGTCVGTTSWSVGGIALYVGQNIITVTASDHSPGGNAGSDTLTVYYNLPLTISGYVKASGSGISGVVMNGLPTDPSTDNSGYYSDAVPYGWSGVVTPAKSGLTFTPPSRNYSDIASDQVNQDYASSGTAAQPTVTTTAVNTITSTTAVSGGNVVSDGGGAVTARGVCWNFVPNPTIANNHSHDGSGTGTFTSNISGLTPGTDYYVRAYATNSAGTSYGNEVTFRTMSKTYTIPFGQSFATLNWPVDWTTQAEGAEVKNKWSISLSEFAGGDADEMICTYQNAEGTLRLITPPLNTSGYKTLRMTFRHLLKTWDIGGVTLKIQTSPDSVTWTDEAWSVLTSSADIGPMKVNSLLSHNLNRSTTYVAFVVSGNFFYFENWYIDDVSITPSQKDDFVGTWDGQGVYFRNSETAKWIKLASPADLIVAGDLDGDGKDDLIGIWPGQGGVWVRYSNTGAWTKLSTTAQHIATGDMNGDGRVDLLGTWNGQGVFYRDSISSTWVKMASASILITAGDIDGDGIDDLIGIWPTQGGIWVKYSKTGTWAKLSSSARDMATGDINGDGRVDLLGTWDGQGVYYRNSGNGAWVKMSVPGEQVTAGDLDGDGTDDLIGLWTSQGGIWVKYSKTGTWSKLSTPAKDIAAGLMRGAAWGSSKFDFVDLLGPFGGFAEGPGAQGNFKDRSEEGPGGWRFAAQEQKNLIPQSSGKVQLIPGPGEIGFFCDEQKNLFPQETAAKEKSLKEERIRDKRKIESEKNIKRN